MTTALVEKSAPLTAADRCDRCGARALWRVHVTPTLDLLFCGHHFSKHEEALRAKGVTVAGGGAPKSA